MDEKSFIHSYDAISIVGGNDPFASRLSLDGFVDRVVRVARHIDEHGLCAGRELRTVTYKCAALLNKFDRFEELICSKTGAELHETLSLFHGKHRSVSVSAL
jgi:hypothetical protein